MGSASSTIIGYGYNHRQAVESLAAELETMNYIMRHSNTDDMDYFVLSPYNSKKKYSVIFEQQITSSGTIIVAKITI